MPFFPRYRQFWFYHGSMSAVVIAIQLVVFVLIEVNLLLNTVGTILWLPVFTLCALCFRYIYNCHALYKMKMALVIPFSLLLGLGIGLVVAFIILLLLSALFWDSLFLHAMQQKPGKTELEIVAMFMLNNGLIQAFLMCGWIFIYISSTANRRVLEGELKNLKLENTLKEAQIGQLSNQLNPHFLFNSINNIRFMIYESAEYADNMLTALSEILRYSLQSSSAFKVQLKEELRIVHLYVDIAKLQLEDRLNFVLQCDDSLGEYYVPPMIVQLLVENAVKHGLDHIPEGGELSVKVSQEEELIKLIVSNPKPEKKPKSTGSGLGLKNIKQRLELLYQDNYYFDVSETDRHFTVTIELPKELKQ